VKRKKNSVPKIIYLLQEVKYNFIVIKYIYNSVSINVVKIYNIFLIIAIFFNKILKR
jgi:hypothetical protein